MVVETGKARSDPSRAGFALQKMPKSFEAAEAIVDARGLGVMVSKVTHKLNTAF